MTEQEKKGGLEKGSLPLSRGVNQKPARTDVIFLKQLLNFIPRSVLNQTARKTGVDIKARTFSFLSHLAAMLFAQLSHAISLNDVCDWLRLKATALSRLQMVLPSRNTLSHQHLEAVLQATQGHGVQRTAPPHSPPHQPYTGTGLALCCTM
jgi:hypothetical protein